MGIAEVCAILLTTGTVAAAPPSALPADAPPSAQEDSPDPQAEKLSRAKQLFKRGNELRRAGHHERALALYRQSRAVLESVPNTINAAICLDQLGRYGEALELYERLQSHFRSELSPQQEQAIAREMGRLAKKAGRITVQSQADSQLVIDGRSRGRLPLKGPVHTLPGQHVVRVFREGFRVFEATVNVEAGQTTSIAAVLVPVTGGGRVRVEAATLAGAQVFVDGAPVGPVPWEGTLPAGKHHYVVRRGDVGSAPTSVEVVEGQTVLSTPPIGKLGGEFHITVKPTSAELLIGGVVVGVGRWEGRLPMGEHAIAAREDGYQSAVRRVATARVATRNVAFVLETDEEHPRWQRAEDDSGPFWLDAFGGIVLAPSLGSEAEERCAEVPCQDNLGLGMLIGVRAGYEFSVGLSLELAGGYLTSSKWISREMDDSFEAFGAAVPTRYTLVEDITLDGPFVGGGVGYRLPFAEWFELRAHAIGGVHVTSASHGFSGWASDGFFSSDLAVENTGGSVTSANLLLMPELYLGVRFGDFAASLGLTAAVLALDGPDLDTGDVMVDGTTCSSTPPATIACAPPEPLVAGERAYGASVLLVPSLSVGSVF